MTVRKLPQLLAAGLLVSSLAACGGSSSGAKSSDSSTSGAAATATDKVTVKDFAFSPKDITVKAGTTVTWTFSDSADHTVVSSTGGTEIKESQPLKSGGTFTHAFSTPGTFPYICGIHNYMSGTVVVTA